MDGVYCGMAYAVLMSETKPRRSDDSYVDILHICINMYRLAYSFLKDLVVDIFLGGCVCCHSCCTYIPLSSSRLGVILHPPVCSPPDYFRCDIADPQTTWLFPCCTYSSLGSASDRNTTELECQLFPTNHVLVVAILHTLKKPID
jgi:hypothetical protein